MNYLARLWNAFTSSGDAERQQQPEGRVIHPAVIPVTCRCKVPQPHVHSNLDHWCNSCGGYLGGHSRYHKTGVCLCPPCYAPRESCTPIYNIHSGARACEVCGSTLKYGNDIIHFSTCAKRFPGGLTS